MITQQQLKEYWNYCPETGIFTRIAKLGDTGNIGEVAKTTNAAGYIVIGFNYKNYVAHRLAFLYMIGTNPNVVDHINGVTTDNSWDNLRECFGSENNYNRKLDCTSTTGIKGATWYDNHKMKGCLARISTRYKRTTKFFPISVYKTRESCLEVAELWLRQERTKLHGEFANHG